MRPAPLWMWVAFLLLATGWTGCLSPDASIPRELMRGTGDLGLVIERASGAVLVVEHTQGSVLHRVEGLGDLSHASVVYSRDGSFGFVFGRDGGLTKVNLVAGRIEQRIIQAGNSIGGAISQDGSLIAVSNYEPGGVRVFRSSDLAPVADLPALARDGSRSKVVGLVDAPDQRFVFSLMEAGEIWVADFSDPERPAVQKFFEVGSQPYDALITPDGRHYIAGLFGEDGLALLDLWHPERGVERILPGYGRGRERLPVYKMPHLEGWAIAGDRAFLPGVGVHELLVVNTGDWKSLGRVELAGQPVFAIAEPGGRYVWVNFAYPDNDRIQVVDSQTLEVVHDFSPGKGVLHLEFTPRGEQVWISLRDEDRVEIMTTRDRQMRGTLHALAPSGIFFTARLGKIGL